MSITNHFIDGIAEKKLKHVGVNQTPRLVVIHYSVTNTVADAVKALNKAKLGYHILIEKDGTAFQTRRFTESAAHPGLSNWKSAGGLTLGGSLGRGSVGVCLMNKGFAFDSSAPNGPGKLIYNPDDPSMQRWEKYPAAQVKACRKIVEDLIATYPVAEVVGHHDIAIFGKFDPGPLFDLAALNALAPSPKPLGFRTTVKSSDNKLELRRGPNAQSASIRTLKNGDVVHIRSVVYGPRAQCIQPSPPSLKRYLTRWASVSVDGSDTHSGFVSMTGLASTPLAPALAKFL
ncbi:MAG: N-acetylmuramoyl-L-alanine amidase [Rhizobiaceae bacterium]